MRNTSGLKRWTLQERYDRYVMNYLERQQKLQKYGKTMAESLYNITEYQFQYESFKNTRLAEGKKPGNINQALVSEQAYTISAEQARNILKNMDVKATPMKLFQIRANINNISDEWFDSIRNRREVLKELGRTPGEVRDIIASEYYGS
jgi:hypothetical protein